MVNEYSVSLVENDNLREESTGSGAKKARKKARSSFASKRNEPVIYQWISLLILNKIGRNIISEKEKYLILLKGQAISFLVILRN